MMQYPPDPTYHVGPFDVEPQTVAIAGYVGGIGIGLFGATYAVAVENIPLVHPASKALYVALTGIVLTATAFWVYRSGPDDE